MAKWYTACLLIVMLLALTMHLSMQQRSNEEMNTFMQNMAKKHGWKLAKAQLNMLRGALTLRDLDIHQGALHLHAPYVLLRGHFSDQLTDIRLTEVSMRRAKVVYSPNEQQHFKRDVLFNPLFFLPQQWQRLFSSVRTLKLHQMMLRVASLGGDALTIKGIHIESEVKSTERTWFASSQSDMGMFQWRSTPSKVEFQWQHVNADLLRSFFQPSAHRVKTNARLKGHIIWQDHQLSGSMDWRVKEEHGRLAWQGNREKDAPLTVTVHAKNWPLQGIPTGLPLLQDCVWQSGALTGTAHVTRQQKEWQISSKHLDITEPSSVDTAGETCFQVESLHLNDATWQWARRQITIKEAFIKHGQWDFPTHVSPSLKKTWEIKKAQLHFSAMAFNSDSIQLTDMYGTATITTNQWKIQAHSKKANKDQWTIQLSSPKAQYKAEQWFTFTAKGESLSPTFFRHVLPSRLADRAAITADIDVSLTGSVTRLFNGDDRLSWHIQGDVLMSHVNWARDGWQGMTNKIQINDLQYKTGQAIQAKTIMVDNWALTAPLTPFSIPASKPTPWQPFWLDGWHIERLQLGQGTFSIGWKKAVWMHLNPFTIQPLMAGVPITAVLEGAFLDGDLTAKLRWQPWQNPSKFELALRVRHALPFATNAWLLQSDLPDFIRGRLNVMVDLTSATTDIYNYTGQFHASLAHGSLAQGLQESETFVQLVGVTPRELLETINTNEAINIDVPLQGSWQTTPMNWGRISSIVLQALREKVNAKKVASYPSRKTRKILAYIRLHQEDGLWPNERARVRNAIQALKKDSALVLELVPQLGRHSLDESFIQTTRHTQKLIEDYLHEHQINPNRILPLWPQKAHKAGGEAGIRLQTYAPTSWK